MTDFGRRSGVGDMLKAVYDPNEDGVIAAAQTEADMTKAVYDPAFAAIQILLNNHKTQHQSGGTDEINVTGLTGLEAFVDCGDPAAWDFETASFTRNGAWHDLDLSSKVPEGAKWVYIIVRIDASAADQAVVFRENGNSNAINVRTVRIASVGLYWEHLHTFVRLDAARKIEYLAASVAVTEISLHVAGWII